MKSLILILSLLFSCMSFASFNFGGEKSVSEKYKDEFKNKSNAFQLGVRTIAIELCVCKFVLEESEEVCLAETFETQPKEISPEFYNIKYGTIENGDAFVSVSMKTVIPNARVTYNDFDTCTIQDEPGIKEKTLKFFQVLNQQVRQIF